MSEDHYYNRHTDDGLDPAVLQGSSSSSLPQHVSSSASLTSSQSQSCAAASSEDDAGQQRRQRFRRHESFLLPVEFEPNSPTKTKQLWWWRTGRVSAFVTFLKALFGVSLLSSPRVLNETGLLLGTLTYIVIILACAFSCYLLLQARSAVVMMDHQNYTDDNKQNLSRWEQQHHHQQQVSKDVAMSHHHHHHSQQQHIITYGELGRKLLGSRASVVLTFLIVAVHLLFGSGMVSGAMHEFLAATGFESNHNDDAHHDDDNDGYYSPTHRAILALILFPFISLLLQFRTLADLVKICAAGLFVYMVGCIFPMLYVAIIIKSALMANNSDEHDQDGGHRGGPADAPNDMWEWKFDGLPRFVGSTICAIEGINLAIPTANSLHATNPQSAVPVVSAVVFSYGFLTLMIAWIGYLGGLGGGPGTKHGEDACHDISYCLDSEIIGRIHQLSLCAALLLTLPIILFPSIEMLEIWTDERNHQLETGRTSSDRTINEEGWNGFVYVSTSFRKYSEMMRDYFGESSLMDQPSKNAGVEKKAPSAAPFMNRHWKLRVAHAAAVCLLGAMERSFKPIFTLLSGVGLSIAGFVLPCLLYGFAKEHISTGMKLAMAGLAGLGICNIVLVCISVFTDHDFVSRRGEHHHHDEED